MQDHTKIRVWRAAHRLSTDLHDLLADIPRIRVPNLRSQLLRAASSVPTNIVEGCGAESRAEFARYLDTALKSLKELEYHLLRLHEARYIDARTYRRFDARVTDVRRQLYAFTMAVRRRREKGEL